jgi:hypothetical protein
MNKVVDIHKVTHVMSCTSVILEVGAVVQRGTETYAVKEMLN